MSIIYRRARVFERKIENFSIKNTRTPIDNAHFGPLSKIVVITFEM